MGRTFATSYLAGEPAAQPFFAPGFRDPAARMARTRLAAERATPAPLLEVLAEQQARLPASAARQANLAALSSGRTAIVATGQQVGLFLGPLYSFYKAASAIAVARALQAESGVRCVPLYWLQTEDHDFVEIRTSTVADREGEPLRLTLADEAAGQGRVSIAHRVLPAQVAPLLDTLAEALPPGPAADETLGLLRDCYRPGVGLAAAFASALASVFADDGLLIFDPREARVAALAAPIYRSCVEDGASIEARLKEREAALASAGFDQQVPIRE
ncbi:MAG TPA: bacillithiol biosynthesis BshC, partial [Steroidobacteraceae bacterium]|nr:bacillithiol biosynthesis BshC [Steroidobacteraceae bacterium]